MNIQAIDYAILCFIQNMQSEPLNILMVAITRLGDGGILWLAIAFVCFLQPKYRRCSASILVALVIGLLIGNMTIKPIIARPRPFQTYSDLVALVAQGGFSFPSAHAMSSFASATAIFFYHKKLGVICLIAAILIAFSRLYVCVHYPSDVLCGSLIGIAIGIGASILVRWSADYFHYSRLRR